jgi:plasmid stabilization system protein ParE
MTARAARPQKGAVPLSEAELDRILPRIDEADPEWQAYVRRIEAYCHRLTHFPNRGSPQDDLEPGLRRIAFEGRATIYYRVEADRVRILRILAAGRDPTREFRRS